MTDYNVHSTLFLKYLRVTWHILLLLAAIIFAHLLLLIFFPESRREVTDLIWILSEFLKLTLSLIAWRQARDFVKRAWLFIIIYGLLILSGILIRSYYDIFLHIYTGTIIVPYLFASGNIAVVTAFILFSHSRETSFKLVRQINLLGLILVTMLAVSYLINYNTLPESAGVKSIVRATIAGVINLSAFIIGVGVYWTGVWKRDVKRRTVFIFILSSTLISFILNNLYYTKKILSGAGITGGFPDLLGTAAILLICLAAWHEVKFKEQYDEKADYNLFYVSRIERIIPAITLVTMLAVIYFNSSKLDSQLIRNLVFFMIPYIVFLIFFELYSYRSEDAILSVLSLSPIGVHITDRKFTKTYFINKSLFDILRSAEIPPGLIIGDNISDDLKQNIIDSIAKNITMDHVETALIRPDGTKLNAQCKIIPARYYSYDIVITWILDITDRKKYEGSILQQKYSAEIASLYKSELLNNLSNRMQSGYVTMKIADNGWPDLIFTGMNKRIIEIFDFKNDLSGRSFREIFPDPNQELIAQLIEVLSTGVSLKRELTVRRAGKVFIVLIFKASDDEVACLIDDITENKRKEREMIDRERELSNLLKNLPGMVYRCRNDKEWTMFFVSQGSFDLTGYKPEELMDGGAVSWNGLVHPDDREKVWIEGQVAISRRESYYLDYRIITKDSSIKYVFEKGLGVYDENGELLFLEGFIFDITKQKEAETILRENEIKEKEVEKARALGQMAGGIAHDLNNRLMGIGSYTSLIDLKVQDPGIKKYTEGIQESIRKSTELIENLLIFARQSDLITDIFSTHDMIREMTLKLQDEFPEDIIVILKFSADNDNVRGDYKQIFKAVSNMVSNAKDAMPSGGKIIISTENKIIDNSNLLDLTEGDTKKVFIVIKVSDTGMGIEKDNLSRIFDPFYTTKPVGSGKGLSLSAVYGTIQAHKGAITVDSVPGKGTSFSIYLPVV